jgi:precorrin-6B methylase 2
MMNLAELSEDDIFFDLGSGLGQVTILVNLLSGIKAIGIEYEPAYCNYAQACASQLNLSNVEFINTEAQKGDYRQGTVFFMYTPFEGNMLQDMLNILQKEAQTRLIRIFTYGPCSPHVARQNWLNCVNGNTDDPYKLYEFRSNQY